MAAGRGALGLAALLAAGCGWHQQPLPAPLSPEPVARTGGLRAGFGRADVTPPPGAGLAGNGPEGLVSTGWRHRLHARALALEDARGERLALVVIDLPTTSTNLHRLAAERLQTEVGVGADRLIVSATHTHAGPGHFYAERQYNDNAARLPGYDPAVADLLVDGIVTAVRQAFRELAPARAAWGVQRVKGFNRNRSLRAYCRNPAAVRVDCPSDSTAGRPRSEAEWAAAAAAMGLDTAAVDDAWVLLRVDRDTGNGYRPAGAYSVFAVHGTATPSVTTLLDGDLHAVVERRLERLIDAANGEPAGFTPRATHLFANGNEGDMSPNRDLATTQCPLPRLRPSPFAGPRTAPAPWIWEAAHPDTVARCLGAARRFIDSVGTVMGDSAYAHFLRLGPGLRDDLTIARAFASVWLPGRAGLCSRAVVGSSTAAGAADVPTRVAGWKVLGLVPIGFEQGGSARRDPPRGCQAEKRTLLGPLQPVVISGEHGFAEVAQLTVARVGDQLLGAVPVEATVTVGRRFREAVLAGADSAGRLGLRAVVVGHANGFLQYITTRAEYAEQAYEGGSTLYGPGSAEGFAAELRALGAALAAAHPQSPPAVVGPITAYPGAPKSILPRAGPRPPRDALGSSRATCTRDGWLRIEWFDDPPAWLRPGLGQVLAIEREQGGAWRPFAWDDQPDVVVEALGSAARGAHRWQATVARPTAGLTLRLRLPARPGRPEHTSAGFTGCAAGGP